MLDRRSLVTTAFAAASCASVQRRGRNTLAPERAETIDRLVGELTSLAMFNGVITIDVGGSIAFQKAYGFADYERRIPFADRTRFKIASISKPMTDAALASLLDRGELRLDDPLSRYLPQFPSAERITLELITQHRSGIPHTNNQPWGEGPDRLSLDEVLERLARLPLDFEPGTSRRYSNGGYSALARVLELVHGAPYEEVMRDLVFAPLGMRNSSAITNSNAPPPHLAKGYQPGEQIAARASPRPYLVELRPGGGSLCASARDVMTFFQAAWRGRLPGAREFPGLFGGTGATRAADGRSPGVYMDIYYDAAADMIVSSMANNYAAEFRWAENLALIALGQPALFTTLPAVDAARLASPSDAWVGEYRDERGDSISHVITRSQEGRLLLTERQGGSSRALIPLRDGGYLDPLYYGVGRADPAVLGRLVFSRLYEGGFTTVLLKAGG